MTLIKIFACKQRETACGTHPSPWLQQHSSLLWCPRHPPPLLCPHTLQNTPQLLCASSCLKAGKIWEQMPTFWPPAFSAVAAIVRKMKLFDTPESFLILPFPYTYPPVSWLWVMLCLAKEGRAENGTTAPSPPPPASCLQCWPRSRRGGWKRQGEECWLGTHLPQQQQQLKQSEQWHSIGAGVSLVPPRLSRKPGKEEPCCSATDSPWKSRARHFWNTARELWVLIYFSDRFMMCKLWEHLPTCWKAAERETRWQTLGMTALSSIQLVYTAVWKDFMYCNLCTTRPRTWGCHHLQKSIPCEDCLKLIHKISTF